MDWGIFLNSFSTLNFRLSLALCFWESLSACYLTHLVVSHCCFYLKLVSLPGGWPEWWIFIRFCFDWLWVLLACPFLPPATDLRWGDIRIAFSVGKEGSFLLSFPCFSGFSARTLRVLVHPSPSSLKLFTRNGKIQMVSPAFPRVAAVHCTKFVLEELLSEDSS